ncbi:hypothetical protein EV175_001017 [Coemansia sp. RSA 1933]|nr:hypothetical protein EV175_001017 [Coemansia sp. RSA 1933]
MTFDNSSNNSSNTVRAKGRVICKDGRVFHACEVCRKKRSRCDGARPQCTACRTRGLPCEYRAMRKRGRHGKREDTVVTTAAMVAAAVAGGVRSPAMRHVSIPLSTAAMAAAASSTEALNLLAFPRFFSLPTEMPIHAAAGMGTMAPPSSTPQQQQQQQQQPLGSMFLGSPSPGAAPAMCTQMSSPLLTQPPPQPPIAFRSMSAASNPPHLFDPPPPGSLSMVAAAMNAAAAAATIQSPMGLAQTDPRSPIGLAQYHQPQRSPSTAAMAAAVAAFHFSPTGTPTTAVAPQQQQQQQQQHLEEMAHVPSIAIPHTGSTAVEYSEEEEEEEEEEDDDDDDDDDDNNNDNNNNNNQRMEVETGEQRAAEWRHAVVEEEQVLDGLDADGADSFGRPLFDIGSYPLPTAAEVDEQTNGMFEYFYMGEQTLHEATFRRRLAAGTVSPILIYAIMAVGSRYSRKPSLHSINGMAFLNGDRHASTACGLASIQLNHGDLGSVDSVHAMLFLSVYFMGQGNMLKSRMYLVKAVCTARAMGFQNMDATFVPSSPMVAFRGNFDRRIPPPSQQQMGSGKLRRRAMCSCPTSVGEVVELETKRRIWWFLVFVDYFTANVMNMPVEIAPDSYCVRLPCSDEEWASASLNVPGQSPQLGTGGPMRDLGFGDRLASAQQGAEYQRLNGFHDCRPPWVYRPGAFYLERLMIEFCDHLRRFNSLRSLAMRSFFYAEPAFVDEGYPYLRRRRQFVAWGERLEKVKSAWSWLHLQLNKWLDSILLRFSEVINRVPSDQYNRLYRHQYYYYLIAAHSTIIMSHGVVLQLYSDFSRYMRQQQEEEEADEEEQTARFGNGGGSATTTSQTPPVDYATLNGMTLSEGLSEFAIGGYGSAMAPLMQMAQGLTGSTGSSGTASSSSVRGGSSIYGSVIGSPASNGNNGILEDSSAEMADMARLGIHLSGGNGGLPVQPPPPPPPLHHHHSSEINIQRDLFEMAAIAWDGCVSTAEQLASILRGKHPKFVLLGGPPIDVFHEQVRSGDANILSQPGSTFNAPGSGPGADNPILSDPDFYMRLQPSTAWWMFLVAQVQVGHIKRLLKESEGSFKVSARRKALATRAAAAEAAAAAVAAAVVSTPMPHEEPLSLEMLRMQKPADLMRPLSSSVNNSAVMLATAVQLSSSAPAPPTRQALEKRAAIKARASRLVRAYENLSCMVKVLEGMQQYWQCMDYISVIQDILKGSEHPLH